MAVDPGTAGPNKIYGILDDFSLVNVDPQSDFFVNWVSRMLRAESTAAVPILGEEAFVEMVNEL